MVGIVIGLFTDFQFELYILFDFMYALSINW